MTLKRLWILFVLVLCAAIVRELLIKPEPPADSFYMEVRITRPTSPTSSAKKEPDLIYAWYKANDRWRWEAAYSDSALKDVRSVEVSNGDQVIIYDAIEQTVEKKPAFAQLESEPRSKGAIPHPPMTKVGPVPGGDVDLFLGQFSREWQQSGQEKLLGRKADIVEITDAGTTHRFFIDTERRFILRYEARPRDSQEATVEEITRLSLGAKIDNDLFHFDPPGTAVQVSSVADRIVSTAWTAPRGSREFRVPADFKTPSYLPEGWAVTDSGIAAFNYRDIDSIVVRFQPPGAAEDGPDMLFRQSLRPNSFNRLDDRLTEAPLGRTTSFQTAGPPRARITWSETYLSFSLSSTSLSLEELNKVALSIR